MHTIWKVIPHVIAIGSGILLWVIIPLVTGNLEAWSENIYFLFGMPLLVFECFLLGYILTKCYWWYWGVEISLSQAIFIIAKWPTSNLLPFAFIFLALLAFPYLLASYIGSRVRQVCDRRKLAKEG